ncbi:MAG: sensor histidine kinase [Bacteroidia bacterium]
MKLITKTILYYLLFTLPLLAVAIVISYFLVRKEVRDGTDEALWKEKLYAERMIRKNDSLTNKVISADGLSVIHLIDVKRSGSVYSDTVIYDGYEEEELPYRMLTDYVNTKEKTYRVTLLKARVEEEDLMESLSSSLAIIIAVLMFSFFTLSWLLSKYLWKPFYLTLKKLDEYELKNNSRLELSPTKTKEFNHLNLALEKMTDKIWSDFLLQKEFTENASHEMQTPLAVIKARLELLMQSEKLGEKEMQDVQAIEASVNKLSALNKALLLLAKISNKQFGDEKELSLKNTVERVLANYTDMAEAKNISVTTLLSNDIRFTMNSALCDILVTNLLQNAIRHNYNGGEITIAITGNELRLSNTGEALTIKPEELFLRFKKNDNSKESLGLGLAIVKSIAEAYRLKAGYSYTGPLHTFSVTFNSIAE